MKLKLRLRLFSGGGSPEKDSGTILLDSRSLPAALGQADPQSDTDRPGGALRSHLAALPTGWVRDFLRSV
ncbi:hypothetical protein LLH00_00760 [bacterium]|nr:hypothetical protein [bacterium]